MKTFSICCKRNPRILQASAFGFGTTLHSLQCFNRVLEPPDATPSTPRCPQVMQESKLTKISSKSRRNFLRNILLIPAIAVPAVNPAAAWTSYFDKYDQYAANYDNLDGTNLIAGVLGFNALRRQLLDRAKGNVLELGVGTGVNLPLYNFQQVCSVTGLDLSPQMLSLAKKRAAKIDRGAADIQFLEGRAEDVQLPDNTFDTIVDTFSLCVFPEPIEALREMKRLLSSSPDARVLLLEHSLSLNPLLAAYQNLTAEPTAAMSKGCYPNQSVAAMVRQVGFTVLKEERHLSGTITYLELCA
ncbi:unnamed protein product [Chondrus crispus]|uniref:Methyltransferase type 11 domain-containing protein n=1 Tax=Chondrus crispus TaxID=2769 RepID=R7QKW8_CHOCR|nr:unnamed protein product [Chondrus crispus]CDF38020.1 unnamed protein product [Chondrus crispus]|eukprot:XP_005717889.1 unnamed protein product [Chondrus crispus]